MRRPDDPHHGAPSNDEIGRLTAAFNQYSQRIHDLFVRMSAAIAQVMGSSATIAASAEELSQTLSLQAQEVTRIAESVDELATNAQTVAEALVAGRHRVLSGGRRR